MISLILLCNIILHYLFYFIYYLIKSNKFSIKTMSPPSFLAMVVEAIGSASHNRQGTSRAAIANFISNKYNKEKNGGFNAHIRKAIEKGINEHIIKQGDTSQRFKLGNKVKEFRKSLQPKKKKKKTVSKKKKTSAKKKSASKKKKSAAKKKKTTSKKKKTKPKKKTAPKRKSASKKKKTNSKRRKRN